MKRNALLFVFVAAFCAASAYAQDNQAAGGDQSSSGDQQTPAPAGKSSKDARAAKWKASFEAGVKKDCSAEIADGGICAGKDFGSGLEKCLHENRSKLSDGCKVTVRRHPGMKGKGHHGDSKDGGSKSDSGSTDNGTSAPAPAQ
jgi:hypothetical protein